MAGINDFDIAIGNVLYSIAFHAKAFLHLIEMSGAPDTCKVNPQLLKPISSGLNPELRFRNFERPEEVFLGELIFVSLHRPALCAL